MALFKNISTVARRVAKGGDEIKPGAEVELSIPLANLAEKMPYFEKVAATKQAKAEPLKAAKPKLATSKKFGRK